MKVKGLIIAILMMSMMSCNSEKIANSKENTDEPETESKASNISDTSTTHSTSERTIENTKWIITTLERSDITSSEINGKVVHFILDPDGNRVSGYSGCNTFTGSYTLEDGNRISFSYMASTRMMCPNATINESQVLGIFELADNYTIKNDVLSLNVGKRASLAVFEAVYMQ